MGIIKGKGKGGLIFDLDLGLGNFYCTGTGAVPGTGIDPSIESLLAVPILCRWLHTNANTVRMASQYCTSTSTESEYSALLLLLYMYYTAQSVRSADVLIGGSQQAPLQHKTGKMYRRIRTALLTNHKMLATATVLMLYSYSTLMLAHGTHWCTVRYVYVVCVLAITPTAQRPEASKITLRVE
jgi:hypothetical protein